jgi:hypothetical protein
MKEANENEIQRYCQIGYYGDDAYTVLGIQAYEQKIISPRKARKHFYELYKSV